MRVNGAEGFLVMSEDRAKALSLPFASVAAAIERHDGGSATAVQEAVGFNDSRDGLYEQAGLAPGDMDFVQAYDDYPVIVLLQLEARSACAHREKARALFGRATSRSKAICLSTQMAECLPWDRPERLAASSA